MLRSYGASKTVRSVFGDQNNREKNAQRSRPNSQHHSCGLKKQTRRVLSIEDVARYPISLPVKFGAYRLELCELGGLVWEAEKLG